MNILLKCCDMICPVGITQPIFFWIVKDCSGKKQSAYRITVFSDRKEVIWDSGTVFSEQSVYLKYSGQPLHENTKYYWKVVISTDNCPYESESSYFITGLYHTENLKWVAPDKKSMLLLFSKNSTWTT